MDESRIRKIREDLEAYENAIKSAEKALADTEALLDGVPEKIGEYAPVGPEDDADWVMIF